MKSHEADPVMKEMWGTIAVNSEVAFSISAFTFSHYNVGVA